MNNIETKKDPLEESRGSKKRSLEAELKINNSSIPIYEKSETKNSISENNLTIKEDLEKQSREFLETLFDKVIENQYGEIEIRSFKGEEIHQRFVTTIDEAIKTISTDLTKDMDVYIGVNSRAGGRGTKENVKYLNTFHTEVDYGEFGHKKPSIHKTYVEAMTAIQNFPMKPTIIIHSGGGFHCYWVLKTPIKLDGFVSIEKLESVNRKISLILGGDTAADISRVLRAAGTYNFKGGMKREVSLVTNTNIKYDPKDFYKYMELEKVGIKKELSKERLFKTTEELVEHPSIDPQIQHLIKNGNEYGDYKSKSEADMRVISYLINKGVSVEEIIDLYNNTNYKIGDKIREHKSPEKYLITTIEKAREEKTREEKPTPEILQEELVEKKQSEVKEELVEKKQSEVKEELVERKPKKEEEKIEIPFIEITDLMKVNLPPQPLIIHPWMTEKSYTLISGEKGVGKSWVSIEILDSTSKGGMCGPWKVMKCVNSLYVDGEMNASDIQQRFEYFDRGETRQKKIHILSNDYINYKNETLPRINISHTFWQKIIMEYCLENEIKLVVYDNIASLCAGIDENVKKDWDVVNEWLLDMKRKGISTILIHHLGKYVDRGQRGTSAREDNINTSIILTKGRNFGSEDLVKFDCIFDKHRDVNNREDKKCIAKLEWELIRDPEQKTEEHPQGKWIFKTKKISERYMEILKMIADGLTQKEIGEEMGIGQGTISKQIGKMKGERLITKNGKSLTEKGEEELKKADESILEQTFGKQGGE